ncbi:GAF domain-containing protein [Parachitinimonas caeni]|uniref:GAF domain-containing protein n=1 Tax=Parachitinimonas caeni TaxID=3031301 RepID=A0ABT7DSI8_9NEIS|nr:GAF domain-containing protein [Parachitinimonas caeni]MDK2123032.1 GAF domain-containing protein [Parachitinimonas caeni]
MQVLPTLAADTPVYDRLAAQLSALLAGERHPIANTAQFAAFLFQELPALNWAGFYMLEAETLVLGPFQGKVACVRIPLGRGVCGTAAQSRQTQRVANVHEFAGHIACDSASNSEIVIPLIKQGRLLGVLDLDSPQLDRFSSDDQTGLERLCQILLDGTDF